MDVIITMPSVMGKLGPLGRILGPRGLMPNPKTGTVTPDVSTAVSNAKAGMAKFRTDKGGVIHCAVGAADFTTEQLRDNIAAVLRDIRKAKPTTSKGSYLRKVILSTTMGPGVAVDLSSLPE